jgi:hypothetical protein
MNRTVRQRAKAKYIYIESDPKHPREWIVCSVCGKDALVKAHGKGFCSKSCAQKGANNSMVTGKPNEYLGLHLRLNAERGKADHCVWGCESARYEWANLTDDYEDFDDYAQMCKECHQRYDFARKIMEPDYRAKNSKLTEAIVKECRRLHKEGVPQAVLARRYGVAAEVMHNALVGKQWWWVV